MTLEEQAEAALVEYDKEHAAWVATPYIDGIEALDAARRKWVRREHAAAEVDVQHSKYQLDRAQARLEKAKARLDQLIVGDQ